MEFRATFLHELLTPTAPAEFMRDCWEKQSTVFGGHPQRLSGLPFNEDILRAAAGRLPFESVRAVVKTGERELDFAISADQIDPLMAVGATIIVRQPHRTHPPLAELLANLKSDLGYVGQIASYAFFSPPGAGHGFHFDPNGLFNIQIAGSKRWRCGRESAFSYPLTWTKLYDLAEARERFPWANIDPPNHANLIETELHCGDAIYLPGGTWHEACASSEPSLAFNIAFLQDPLCSRTVRRLENILQQSSRWRRTPTPRRFDDRPELDDSLATEFVEAAKQAVELALHGKPDRAEDAARGGGTVVLERGDCLVAPSPLRYTHGDDHEGAPCLVVSNLYRSVTMDLGAIAFVERLCTSSAFKAADALQWLEDDDRDWPEVREALGAFIERGMLVRRASSG